MTDKRGGLFTGGVDEVEIEKDMAIALDRIAHISRNCLLQSWDGETVRWGFSQIMRLSFPFLPPTSNLLQPEPEVK